MIPVSCSEGDVNIAVTTHISITFSLMLHSSPIRHLMVCGRTFCSASARAQMSEAQTRGRNHLLAATFPSRFSITFANKIVFKRKYFYRCSSHLILVLPHEAGVHKMLEVREPLLDPEADRPGQDKQHY